MLIFLYLLLQTRTNSTLLNEQFPVFFIIYIIELVIYAMPIVIAVKTKNIKQKNDEIQQELSDIKKLLILQNELLRNQRPPYNQ